jgi:hypothetical protein
LTDKEAKQTLFNNKKEDIDDAHLKLKKLEGQLTRYNEDL